MAFGKYTKEEALAKLKAKQDKARTRSKRAKMTPKQKRKAKEVVRWGIKLWSVKKADLEFSKWLRSLRDYTCEMCGYRADPPTQEIQNSHYIGRSAYSTRYNPLNCDVLCASCHSKMEDLKQYDYRDWKLARIGEEAHNNLLTLAKQLNGAKKAVFDCMKLMGKI